MSLNFPQANHILTKCYADMQEITKGIDHAQDSLFLVEKYKTGYRPPDDIQNDDEKHKPATVKVVKGSVLRPINRNQFFLCVHESL